MSPSEQKRTEIAKKELAVGHRELREIQIDIKHLLGEISQMLEYSLEDKIISLMPEFTKKHYGIDARRAVRKNLVYPDGKFDELNIYLEGEKEGKKTFVIGESKAQPDKRDVDKFHDLTRRVRSVLEGELFFFLTRYSFDPAVENYIREKYPDIEIFKSYEFEQKCKDQF